MKAEDLMIGDWVMLDGKEPKQITGLKTHSCKHGYVQIKNLDCSAEYLEPVPLTPEILEKNGFKYMTGLWYIQTKEIRPIQIVFKETNVITLSINCTPVPINLKHVHQLQHALRLYGIEKEIIL